MQNINDIYSVVQEWAIVYGLEIVKSVIIIVVGVWIINKICRIFTIFMSQTNLEISLVSFFNSALKFFLRVILILLLMSLIGINITSVITAISAFIVTFGLVTKDIFSNFASGIFIILNKPIRVGDYIEFEGIKGTVTKIEMMFTTLLGTDETSIIIPNFRLSSNNIIRKSPFDICKFAYTCIIYDKNSKQDIAKVLTLLFVTDKRILQLPPPEIKYTRLDKESMEVNISLFCEKRYIKELKQNLIHNLKEPLKKHGFGIKNDIS